MTSVRTILLDGGMGRQLARMGAPFRQPEWSALALLEAPDMVRQAHAQFIAAGAEVITTNSYALVPFHIGETRFADDGPRLVDLSGRLARQAADAAGRSVKVAGSLPPLFGSYRPDLFDASRAPALLQVLIAGLAPHVDLWLAETQGSIREAEAASRAVRAIARKPLWISYTLEDEVAGPASVNLRSGEPASAAVQAALTLGAEAVLFNCSQPEAMAPAIDVARAVLADRARDLRIGVYANAFPPQSKSAEANAGLSGLRGDLDPERYLAFVADWIDRGASIVGGCCGIGPEHIAVLRAEIDRRRAAR
jgi:S-methylmethionine-dependent homocysteine/selenocysteine methylase